MTLTFLGGLLIGVLLVLLMRQLIEMEDRVQTPPPDTEIVLHLPRLEPPEPETREPRQAPEKPEPVRPPEAPPVEGGADDPDSRVTLPEEPGRGEVTDLRFPPPHWDTERAAPGDQALCTVMIAPHYPRQAARQGIQGHVTVAFTIRADGGIAEVEILDAEPRGVFEAAARQAVARWRCQPREIGDRRVPTRVRQTIEFRLDPPAG